jgi:hypothetical protein
LTDTDGWARTGGSSGRKCRSSVDAIFKTCDFSQDDDRVLGFEAWPM